MTRVVELPLDGEIDLESAVSAEFLGWNLGGSRPPLILIRTWAEEIPRHQHLARPLGPEQPLYSMGHPTGDRDEDYPERTDLPVIQLWKEDSRRRVEGDTNLGWAGLLEGELHIVPVPGDHLTMFAEDHVDTLARRLEIALAGS